MQEYHILAYLSNSFNHFPCDDRDMLVQITFISQLEALKLPPQGSPVTWYYRTTVR